MNSENTQNRTLFDDLDKNEELREVTRLWPFLSVQTKASVMAFVRSENIPTVYNCGYGGRTWEEFIELLKSLKISVLIDIRSVPYTRKPGFSKKNLEESLPCRYMWCGQELGGKEGIQMERWTKGLGKVSQLVKTERVILMCCEAKLQECHRENLVQILAKEYQCSNISV